MAISTAIPLGWVSKTVGYELQLGNFQEAGQNLPQSIVLLGEANTDKQSGLETDPVKNPSWQDIGTKYGYGSPIAMMYRILRPPLGGQGVGNIPVTIIAQASDGAATATSTTITVGVTTITKSATHKLRINGRTNFDGKELAFSVTTDDTATTIGEKIDTLINSVANLPISSAEATGVVTVTTKWEGATSAGLVVEVVTTEDIGITYTVAGNTDGTGTVNISTSLATFGEIWHTVVINPYGSGQFTALNTFNGNPSDKSGRYDPTVFKPFRAIWGSVLSSKTSLLAITDVTARKTDVTNTLALAPASSGWDFEAAVNGAGLYATVCHNTPHLDIAELPYWDMPIPSDENIGDLSDPNNRNDLVVGGCSTAVIKNGKYVALDFVTCYHPDSGDPEFQFRFARNLNVDDNVRYSYRLRQIAAVEGNVLGADNQIYSVTNVVKPKMWKQELFSMYEDLAKRALIIDTEFSEESTQVAISDTNAGRFEDSFSYKRTEVARILSTTATAGFQYGNA